ncbi:unnamed protein product [Ceutorhynchus assimilis]|uniref:DUF753 domain-containing protein n=1 Tax=Ceutorhynchus assimilis TaxID=467358 RepID=A0A9N9MM11_9CUCU|nr:unnamed protein product [Ceutorhynchus assimilis]
MFNFYFLVAVISLFGNNFAYDVNFDEKGLFCFICDSSEDPNCLEPTQSMAEVCGTKDKCFKSTVKNDLAGEQIIRGCTSYSEGAEQHECRGTNQEKCEICNKDLCNNVTNLRINFVILVLIISFIYFV